MLLHPFFLLGLSWASVGAVLICVPPRLPFRLLALGTIAAFMYKAVGVADLSQVLPENRAFFGKCMFAVFLYANYFLCLATETPSSDMTSLYSQLRWATETVLNPRGVGRSWQIRNMPTFSRTDDKHFIPSRKSFIWRRIFLWLWFNILSDVYYEINSVLRLRSEDFAVEKQYFFRRLDQVTAREVVVRLWLPFYLQVPTYTHYSSLHCLVSTIAVILGDSPSQWPPLFGDISDTYSLRQFWR